MKRLTSIVAMDHHGAIGAGETAPWRLRTNRLFFEQAIGGKVVIIGRKTLDALGGKPLGGRFTIVLSHNRGLSIDSGDCRVVHSVAEALDAAARAGLDGECFVAGGASIYEQFAPFVDRYLISLVDKVIVDADAYFNVGLFSSGGWQIADHGSVHPSESDEVGFTIFDLKPDEPGAIGAVREARIKDYRDEAARRLLARMTANLRRSAAGLAVPAAAVLARGTPSPARSSHAL